jgi:hypothetical protein
MDCLIAVLGHQPLAVHLSVLNPAGSRRPQLVPRTLIPLGLSFTLEVTDELGTGLYRSERPKQKPKLHPDRDESYLSLEPGYSFGSVFTVEPEDLDLKPGRYRLRSTYSNGIFTGPASNPVGELTCSFEYDLDVP